MSEVFPIPAMPILTVPGSSGGATGPAGPTGPTGSGAWNIYTTTVGVTAAIGDFVRVDTTSAPVTVVLPTAATGGSVRVKKISVDSNVVTVTGSIDGQGAWTLGLQYSGVEVTGDGSTWNTSG